MYTDPAANAAISGRFISRAWPMQDDRALWAGNVPLHAMVLTPWIKLTGLSPVAVRFVNYLYAMVGVAAIWLAALRLRLVDHARLRLTLVILLLTGQGIAFSFRSGRPDMICFMLSSLVLLTATIHNDAIRLSSILCLGATLPWAGLQTLPFIGIMSMLVLGFGGPRFNRELLALCLGAGCGIAALYTFYGMHGVWPDFLRSVRGHTAVGNSLFRKVGMIPALYLRDLSLLFLTMALALLMAYESCYLRIRSTRAVVLGLSAAILIPAGLHLSGKFPAYYSWMAYGPCAMAVCAAPALANPSRRLKPVLLLLLGAAIFVGWPTRLCVTAFQWSVRDYRTVESFMNNELGPSDNVYCDYQAYYAARNRCSKTYLPSYLPAMRAEEKAALTAIVIRPERFAVTLQAIGGEWRPVPDRLLDNSQSDVLTRITNHRFAETYKLQVYRKFEETDSTHTGLNIQTTSPSPKGN